MPTYTPRPVYQTEDVLMSLCDSVTKVLNAATQGQVHYSGMVQRITRTCLKPDIGCFVLFDGGFSGLVILNFSGAAAAPSPTSGDADTDALLKSLGM
jgi:hypothetical protein